MKLTVEKLKLLIRETIQESEDVALYKHRIAKRARGEYPPRPTGGYEETRTPEEMKAAHDEAMIEATLSILANPVFGGSGLMVSQNIYDLMAAQHPEVLDRLTVSQSRRRR